MNTDKPLETKDVRRGWTSASNAEADLRCAGRHLAQRGLPELPENEFRATGSRVHEALANVNKDGLTLDEQEIYEDCQVIEQKKILDFFGHDARQPMKIWVEERFWVRINSPDGGEIWEHSGQPDMVLRARDRALIIDRKALWGEVAESPSNLQLRDYACLVRGNLMISGQIGVVIVQPRVSHDPPICVYEPADLARAEKDMFARVAASNRLTAQRVAGEVQCKYCRAKLHCTQYQQWASVTVPMLLPFIQTPVAEWTPEQRTRAMNAVKPARDLLDEIEDHVREGLEKDPQFCPGWFLAPGMTREIITRPQEVFDRFAALGGTLEGFLQTITVVKTRLKEQLAAVTGAKGKALADGMRTLTDGLIEVKVTAPMLKKGSPQ